MSIDKSLHPAALSQPVATSDHGARHDREAATTLLDELGKPRPSGVAWRRFRRHRLAFVSAIIVVLLYLIALTAEFVAPYDPLQRNAALSSAPPQRIHFVHEGRFGLQPFVYGWEKSRDPATLSTTYVVNQAERYPLNAFVRGDAYRMWGLFSTDLHLFGTLEGHVNLFGTDSFGRDLFSRTIYGARLSLSVGLIGVAISLVLGVVLGGVSGYWGGLTDNIVQRAIEFLRSVPTLPLWMGLSAALPHDWSVLQVYFAITIILSLVAWTDVARVVRGQFLFLRKEEFVTAAVALGARHHRVILRHLVPNVMGYLIVSLTLAVPQMILAETALSFLGLGLKPPAISWGVLLQQAQNLTAITLHPWLLYPAPFIVVTVLAFNFLGDGLRDITDPHDRQKI